MDPTIGRIVVYRDPEHYVSDVPAIITSVNNEGAGTIDLTAFPPGASPAPHSAVARADWNWPPRA